MHFLFEFPPIFMIFQPPDTTKSMKIIEKPLFFQWFCESHFSCFFPSWQPFGSHFRSKMGARASKLGFLRASWHLSGGLFCFLGTTFAPSSSLRALSGCLLEPNCAPKAFQDHSSNVFWSQNLQISSKFDSKIMGFPTDSNSSMPSNSPVLQASNHPIIRVGTAECAEHLIINNYQ